MIRNSHQSSALAVSRKRQAWRESVILNRASGTVRNRDAYLRKSLPEFIRDETHEVGQWLVARLVEHIDHEHPSIEDMKAFVRQAAHVNDLPLPDDQIESVIEIAYFKWKGRVLEVEAHKGSAGQNRKSGIEVRA
jgi:hypothetical protein